MVKTPSATLAAAAACLVLLAAPAGAQESNFGLGVSYMTFGPFVQARPGVLSDDLVLDPGVLFGLYAERWFNSSSFGIQVGGTTTKVPLDYPGATGDVGVTSVGLRALLRYIGGGQARLLPFVNAGAGYTWYDFGDSQELSPIPGTGVYLDRDETRQLNILVGIGLDIYPGRGPGPGWTPWEQVGFRLEAVDHLAFRQPFEVGGEANDDVTHNLRFALSLQAAPVW